MPRVIWGLIRDNGEGNGFERVDMTARNKIFPARSQH